MGDTTSNHLHRVMGGAPLAVVVRLLVLSLIVGAIMAGLGLTPAGLVHQVTAAARAVYDLGFGAVNDLGRYVLTGAVIVIPIWLLLRISEGARR